MWQPHTCTRFTLKMLNFESSSAGSAAAPINKAAHLAYSAPETTSAHTFSPQQQPPVAVDPAADMWSIGVIAYELLTKEPVFPEGSDDSAVQRALAVGPGGTGGLPWEEGVPGEPERNMKIPKELRHAVLACLDRDIDNRLSAASMLALWEGAPWERIMDELRADVTS